MQAPESFESTSILFAQGRRGDDWPRLLLVGLAFLLGCFPMADYDVWWHLKTGELIPQRGLPSTDWYSFTSENNAWIDVHWGFQLLLVKSYQLAGASGVVLLKSAAAAVAVAIALTAYRRAWAPTLQMLIWLPGLLLLSSRIYERPEIFSLIFIAVYLTVFFHAERKPALLWLLPLVQVVWANMHGLFIFGPVLLGMYLVEAFLRRSKAPGLLRRVLWTFLVVGAACIVSPYGLRNIELVAQLWMKMAPEGRLYRDNIAELVDIPQFWARGGYESPFLWLLFFLWGLSAIGCLAAWREIVVERRVFRPIALAAFGWLSFQATRNGSHFALLATTVTCWNFGPLGRRWTWRPFPFPLAATVLILATAVDVLSGHWYEQIGGHRRVGLGERENYFADAAMAVAGKPGMPDRALIMHLGHAAQYIYVNGPDRKVFMDGRLELHSVAQFREYLDIEKDMTVGGRWEERLKAIGVDLVLIDGEHYHAQQAVVFASPRWRCVHYDPVMAVFLRRSVALPADVAEFDYRGSVFAPWDLEKSTIPGPTPNPTWRLFPPADYYPDDDDVLADRAFQVALSLVQQPSADPTLRRAFFWRSAQAALRGLRRRPWSVEDRRLAGAAFWRLAGLEIAGEPPLSVRDPWDPAGGLLASTAAALLRQSASVGARDFSTYFYFQELLDGVGDRLASIEPLERLIQSRPKNPAQRMVLEVLPKELESRRTAAARLASTKPPTFAGLESAAAEGTLSAALARFEEEPGLSAAQLDRIATWYLLLGHPRLAGDLIEQAARRGGVSSAILLQRRAAVATASLDFGAARRCWEEVRKLDPVSGAAEYGLAVLAVLSGDRGGLAKAVEQSRAAKCSARQRAALDSMADLLAKP